MFVFAYVCVCVCVIRSFYNSLLFIVFALAFSQA